MVDVGDDGDVSEIMADRHAPILPTGAAPPHGALRESAAIDVLPA
jgi:hypothetical protein